MTNKGLSSTELLNKANEAYVNLKHKGYDRRSFIGGYLSGWGENTVKPFEQMQEFIKKHPEEAKKAWDEASELDDYGVTCDFFISEINEEEEE